MPVVWENILDLNADSTSRCDARRLCAPLRDARPHSETLRFAALRFSASRIASQRTTTHRFDLVIFFTTRRDASYCTATRDPAPLRTSTHRTDLKRT